MPWELRRRNCRQSSSALTLSWEDASQRLPPTESSRGKSTLNYKSMLTNIIIYANMVPASRKDEILVCLLQNFLLEGWSLRLLPPYVRERSFIERQFQELPYLTRHNDVSILRQCWLLMLELPIAADMFTSPVEGQGSSLVRMGSANKSAFAQPSEIDF